METENKTEKPTGAFLGTINVKVYENQHEVQVDNVPPELVVFIGQQLANKGIEIILSESDKLHEKLEQQKPQQQETMQ